MRRFPPPWQVEALDGGFKIVDASGQALAYVYGPVWSMKPFLAKGEMMIVGTRMPGPH